MSQKGLSNILVIITVAVITAFLIGGGAYIWHNTTSELEARIYQLETEITELITSGSKFSFSQEIVEKAREVGVQARKSVVYLEIRYEDDSNRGVVGTAWFLAPGLLITNGHVVDGGAITFTGHTVDGDTFSAELISFSLSPDIAVLRTTYTKAPPLPVGSSEGLKEGDPLVQVGHPGGYGNWLITLGELVKTQRGDLYSDVPSAQGSSGSPILTLDGKVVGMTTGITGQVAGPSAPPSNSEVYQFLEGLSTLLTKHVPIELVLEKVAEWTE